MGNTTFQFYDPKIETTFQVFDKEMRYQATLTFDTDGIVFKTDDNLSSLEMCVILMDTLEAIKPILSSGNELPF